jgi:hypothetical protein
LVCYQNYKGKSLDFNYYLLDHAIEMKDLSGSAAAVGDGQKNEAANSATSAKGAIPKKPRGRPRKTDSELMPPPPPKLPPLPSTPKIEDEEEDNDTGPTFRSHPLQVSSGKNSFSQWWW